MSRLTREEVAEMNTEISVMCHGQHIKRSIVMLVPTLETYGGSVRVATQLANHYAQQGHRVTLVSRTAYRQVLCTLHKQVSCVSLGFSGQRLRNMVLDSRQSIQHMLLEYQADVVFGIGAYETLMLLLPTHRLKVPVVFCDHGALINQWDDKKMRLIRWLSMRRSTKTVVLTGQSKNDYEQLLYAKPQKMVTIPNWIPQKIIIAGQEHTYDIDTKRLLWCGRLSHEKGINHLIDIAAQVLPHHPDWTWDVVGETSDEAYKQEVLDSIDAHQLNGKLCLCGPCSDMMQCYPQYAAVTLTSYREGLPLTLLEGLAFRLPLISFDVKTGPADIIVHGENGWLVPPYNTEQYARYLDEFMSDAVLRQRMSDATQRHVNRFNEQKILQQWDALLDEVCNTSQ